MCAESQIEPWFASSNPMRFHHVQRPLELSEENDAEKDQSTCPNRAHDPVRSTFKGADCQG